MGDGLGRWLPYPTGQMVLDMRRVRGVITFNCNPECTSFVFNDEAPLAILKNALLVAWHMGMRFWGPRISPQAESLDETISVLALKLKMDVDRFKSRVDPSRARMSGVRLAEMLFERHVVLRHMAVKAGARQTCWNGSATMSIN